MTYEEVINHFGSAYRVAKMLGISKQSVGKWLERGFVPLLRQHQLEKLSNGKLKIDDIDVYESRIGEK